MPYSPMLAKPSASSPNRLSSATPVRAKNKPPSMISRPCAYRHQDLRRGRVQLALNGDQNLSAGSPLVRTYNVITSEKFCARGT